MNQTFLSSFARILLLAVGLAFVSVAAPAFAQNSAGSSAQPATAPAAQQNSAKQTTTTTTKAKTEEATGIDPIWLAVGAVALIAVLALLFLATRGRGRDKVVRESTTVIKKE